MNRYAIGCETYDSQKIRNLCDREDVGGIILGDLLCQKRMFKSGVADLILMADRVLQSPKTMFYQAPLYVTSRNMDEVASILNLMKGYQKESFVIVQDFGTARLAQTDGNVRPIWGITGRSRERRFSDDFVKFLKDSGFAGMETGSLSFAKTLLQANLTPFFNRAVPTYDTLGRICYTEYQLGHCSPDLCRSGRYELGAANCGYKMTIDGYMMGKGYDMTPEPDWREASDDSRFGLIVREVG